MKTISTLSETVYLMNSSDYKDRLIAEYAQLELRLQKLRVAYPKVDEMPVEIKTQMNVMESYLSILLCRLNAEDVEIPDIDIMDDGDNMDNDIIIGSKKWAHFCERGTDAEYTFIIQLIHAAREIYPDKDPKEIVTSYMNRTPAYDYWRAFIEAAITYYFEFNPNRRGEDIHTNKNN